MNSNQYFTFTKEIALKIADKAFRQARSYSRPVFIFWGPAGVGKTYTIKEAGTAIHFPVINVRLGQELAEDMSFPLIENMDESSERTLKKIVAEMWPRYKTDEQGQKINRRRRDENGEIVDIEGEYQIAFNSVKTYIENFNDIEKYYTDQGLTIDDAPGGIFFLDEINRIEDKQMFQMIFQLFESGKFKGFVLPEELSLFGACNPSKGYIVSPWFDDKAFSNRCVHMKLTFDLDIALANVGKTGYSDLSIEFMRTHPDYLFNPNDNNFDIPKLDYSMRNLSFFENYVSNFGWKDTDHPELEIELVSAIYGFGAVGPYQTVLDRTAQKAIEPLDILMNYDAYELGDTPYDRIDDKGIVSNVPNTVFNAIEDYSLDKVKSKERKIFLQAVNNNKSDYYYRVQTKLAEYIVENIDTEELAEIMEKNKLRFLRFMLDLPNDSYSSFMRYLLDDENYKNADRDFLQLINVDQDDDATLAIIDIIIQQDKMIEDRVETP